MKLPIHTWQAKAIAAAMLAVPVKGEHEAFLELPPTFDLRAGLAEVVQDLANCIASPPLPHVQVAPDARIAEALTLAIGLRDGMKVPMTAAIFTCQCYGRATKERDACSTQRTIALDREEESLVRSLAEHRVAFCCTDEIDLHMPHDGESPTERLHVRARAVETVAEMLEWAENRAIPETNVTLALGFLRLYRGHKERVLSEDRESGNRTGDIPENEAQLAKLLRLLARLETGVES